MKKKVMITAYDYPTSKIIDSLGFDYILVGDSVGTTVLGYGTTKSVTINDILHHLKAVRRGVKYTPVIADMPIDTYNTKKQALLNAKLLIEAGADLIKIEGNDAKIVKSLRQKNIRVVGHLGLLPQTALKMTIQGRDEETAKKIYADALLLDKAGIELLILECIPQSLAKKISEKIKTPTIGIGAGKYCDGQVLVLHDVIGLSDFQGRMIKRYGDAKETISKALSEFKKDVESGNFPAESNSFI